MANELQKKVDYYCLSIADGDGTIKRRVEVNKAELSRSLSWVRGWTGGIKENYGIYEVGEKCAK